jgi:glutathione S-transferase
MGEVPVLVEGARKLSQSGAILTHLAQQSGKFGSDREDERLEILRWILFDNHKFTSYLATYRFLLAFAKTGDPAVMEFLKGRITGALGIVAKRLATQPFMAGAEPTIADLSLCGYLFYGGGVRLRHRRRASADRRLARADPGTARMGASL